MHPYFMTALDEGLTFESPEWFWALLLMLPLLWLFYRSENRRSALLSKIVAPRLRQELAGRVSPLKRNLRSFFLLFSLFLIIVALAKPQLGYVDQQIKSRGRDIIIAIDTSRSMLSTDTAPTRLGRAKLIAQDLLNLLRGDRVGLIAFAGTAFLQAPLTLDKGAVLTSINDLDTKTIPKGGTDIAAAIHLAIAAFGKGEGTSRALILMTDGEELEESGVEAAKEAAALGIKIFTIGFGSAEGSLIPIQNEAGENDFVRDENGKPVNSKLDAPRLTEIAEATGGFYQPFGQDAAKLIYDKGIVPIQEHENETFSSRKPIERYAWPTTAALTLLALWSLLNEGRRKGFVSKAALFALLGCSISQGTLLASGLTDYQQGNYQGALKDFEQRIQSGKISPEVQFDAGAAAYKSGDYKKAADYFSEAMISSNPKLRDSATYNLANSLVRTGEAAKEDDAKLSDWKNSLQHYETVLKSAPNNKEAKENRDIVLKLIEELKKKQQQKQQDKKNDQNQKKDQKDQNKDQKKNDQSQGGGQDQKDQKDQNSKQDQQSKDDKQQGGGKDSDQQKKQDQNKDQNQPNQKDSQGSNGKDDPAKQDQKGDPTPTPTPNPSASPEQGKDQNSQDQNGQGHKSDTQQGNQGEPTPQPSPQQGKDQQAGEGAQPTPTPSPSPADAKDGQSGAAGEDQKPEEKSDAADLAAGDESKDGKMSSNQARALLRSVQDEEAHQLINQQNRAVDQPLHDW